MEESKQVNQAAQFFITQWQNWLESMGLTQQSLLFIVLIAMVVFSLTYREFITWYFKINQARGDLKALRGEVQEVRSILRDLQDDIEALRKGSSQAPQQTNQPAAPAVAETKNFAITPEPKKQETLSPSPRTPFFKLKD